MSQPPLQENRGDLTGELLRSVSRSFYLSLRMLPSVLRRPVSVAYLLARATDTLADTAEIPVELRREKLDALSGAINFAGEISLTELAALQTNEAERELVRRIPECLREFARLPEFDQREIRIVLGKITQAQQLDLVKFGGGGRVHPLATAEELNEYTYLIAGCVGEFWTEMGFRYLPAFATLPKDEMRRLGREYGAGLQLINILRDAQADLRTGRCYLPATELLSAGVSPDEILKRPEAVWPIVLKWLTIAEAGLVSGMQYVFAINNRRVRLATALPALIGRRTIRRLREAGSASLGEKIKIRRSEVRRLLLLSVLSLGSRPGLRRMFEAK